MTEPVKKRGGKRSNAGRPKGAKTRHLSQTEVVVKQKRAYAIKKADKTLREHGIDTDKILPLQVLLHAMRVEYETQMGVEPGEQDWRDAAALAAMAAPYVHPKLTAVAVSNDEIKPADQILQELDGRTRGLPGNTADNRTIN